MTDKYFKARTGLSVGEDAVTINGTTGVIQVPGFALPATDGSAGQVLKTNGAGVVTWQSTGPGTTYTIDASSTTGGANFNLVGSDASTDTIKFASGTNVTVSQTDASTITIAATDTNTTYTYTAGSTTGGANLTLTGSDASTNTVKLTNGGHITATYTSGTEVTLGSDATDTNTVSTIVARDASGNFSAAGATLGNITVGVATDQTITTTSGNLVLDSVSGTITMNSNGTLGFTLVPISGFNPNGDFTGNIVKGAIRSGTTEAAGDILNVLGNPVTGISIDNTDKVADRTGLVMRNYGASLASALPRNTIIGEAARGTAASPLNLTSGNSIIDIQGAGYTSTGWITDLVNTVPGAIRLYTTEAWSNGLNNTGTGFRVLLQPAATTLTTNAGSIQTSLQISPETSIIRSDVFNFQNKSAATTVASFDNANRTFNITGPSNEVLLRAGNVNILEAGSTWQSVLSPGFKYTGLMSSSTQTNTGSYFEMSSRWKASSGTSTYDPPQNNWGLGKFGFTADNTTTNTNQLNAGYMQAKATENWTSTATGSKIIINTNKAGVANTGIDVLDLSPESATIKSDTLTLKDSSNINLVGNKITYNRVYGQWQYDATVTPAASNTAYVYPIASGTTDFANIASVGSTSRIIPGAAGMYKLQFSLQVENADNGTEHTAYIWWRKNGTDVTGSMGRITVPKAGATIAGWDNMISSANTTDYWELAYATDDATHISFPYYAATAFGPATASLFITLVPVGA